MSIKALIFSVLGLANGRHKRSPRPLIINKPSESCTEGRKSSVFSRPFGECMNILVAGARPTLLNSTRGKSTASTSIRVFSPGRIEKRYAPDTLGLSSRAWTTIKLVS
ncbi:Uncharacterised protein [Vibrio cholerae]|nr:Uncharacterised protein [Vibrio cholerae]